MVLQHATSRDVVAAFRPVGNLTAFNAYSDDEVWTAIEAHRAGGTADEEAPDLKRPEWEVLVAANPTSNTRDFLLTPVAAPKGFEGLFEKVVLVERPREVRALIGFTRIESPGDYSDTGEVPEVLRAPLSRGAPTWVGAAPSPRWWPCNRREARLPQFQSARGAPPTGPSPPWAADTLVSPDLLDAICHLASRLPATAVRRVALGLRGQDPPLDVQRLAVLAGQGLDPDNRGLLDTLLQTWASADRQPRGSEVAAALEAAVHQDRRLRAEVQLGLVWTGPSSVSSGLRQTGQVLYDLIDSAKTSVLVVAFAAYRVPKLVHALRRAVERHVRVIVVLEDREESGGKVTVSAAQALRMLDLPAVEVYTWPLHRRPRNERGEHGSLHTKFVVVDGERFFPSSANLTEFAMTLNAELGVLISGGDAPKQALDHVLALMRDGTLVQVGGR